MLVSDYILNFLKKKNIKNVFLITGGAIAFIVDAFSRQKNIKYTCVAHEQAAAMMADSYSRLGPGWGATMTTSGPGATNLITGIACSWFDSIPTIHITGQVNDYETSGFHPFTKNVRQIGFQETDIVSMVKPITKFSYRIKNENEIRYILEKAHHISQNGRPGPVLIDIPMNFQRKKIDLKKQKKFKNINNEYSNKIYDKKIKYLFKKLKSSKRPVLIVGGGVRISNQKYQLIRFLKKIKIPIVSSWSGKDSISNNHENYIGSIGVYGSRAANFAIQNSDFVLNLGSRLDTRVTGGVPKNFARNAFIVSIDIDKNELNKKRGLKNNLKICTSLDNFFSLFLKKNLKLSNDFCNDWIKKCKYWREKYPIILPKYFQEKNFVNPYVLMHNLNKIFSKNEIVIADDGAHLTWAIQGLNVTKNQRLFSAFGNSPMGYAFPAAIGASIALNKKRIVCIDGDGSIQINIQELQTMVENKLPIKLLILNNNGYGIIKQFQELYLNKRFEGVNKNKGVTNPSFKDIAKAYSIRYSYIKDNKSIEKNLKKSFNLNVPEIIEINIKSNQKIIPKLAFGNPLEDLSPLLSRDEFKDNMIVPTISKNKKINESN